jgi:homoserine kinase type II
MLNKQTSPKSDLARILQRYDLGLVKKIKPIATSGNISFLIEADSGKYFLRLCPEGQRWRSKEEIASELELIAHLNKNSFPAPKPIADKEGKTVIEYKNKFGYLREYDLGREKIKPTIKQVNEFGRILGWYHRLIEGYQTKNKRNHFWDLKTTQANFSEDKKIILKSSFREKEKFVNCLQKELSSLSFSDKLPKGMIHEDLGKRHVLWKNGKISCIIDFDRCYYGQLVLDLGQALRGWCFINWQKWSNDSLTALLKGYSQERKLTDLEKKHLFRAVKFGILERGLSFALRSTATHDSADEDFAWRSVSDLLKLLNEERFNDVLRQI